MIRKTAILSPPRIPFVPRQAKAIDTIQENVSPNNFFTGVSLTNDENTIKTRNKFRPNAMD